MDQAQGYGQDADLGTTGEAGSLSPLRLDATALRLVPWLSALDAERDPLAWAVGGTVLRALVVGGRDPRDLDVQYEGSLAQASQLQARLRARGVPANVRSLADVGVRDIMTHAAGWRRVKYQDGILVADLVALRFLRDRVAVILSGLPDSPLAEKSASWVLKEYPGASVERQ